jgi:hypothetical protein
MSFARGNCRQGERLGQAKAIWRAGKQGVMRDPKFHFVNSSSGPKLRDSPENFVEPRKASECSKVCIPCRDNHWIDADTESNEEKIRFFQGFSPLK